MASYDGFEIKAGQRLALVFTEEPTGDAELLLWRVPSIWDRESEPDQVNELNEVGLMIGGQENIYPNEIRLARDDEQFTDRTAAKRIELEDIKIGDEIIVVDPFVMDGETGPEYELRFTVNEDNQPDGDGYFFLAALDFEPEDVEYYRA